MSGNLAVGNRVKPLKKINNQNLKFHFAFNGTLLGFQGLSTKWMVQTFSQKTFSKLYQESTDLELSLEKGDGYKQGDHLSITIDSNTNSVQRQGLFSEGSWNVHWVGWQGYLANIVTNG